MTLDAQNQAATWRIRRATRSRRFIGNLTPWQSSLTVAAGDYVSSFGLAFQAQGPGVTGTEPPNNTDGASFTGIDGILWLHIPLLLTPQPTI